MNHSWFRDFNWTDLLAKRLEAPYKPFDKEKDWIKNFDPSFTIQ